MPPTRPAAKPAETSPRDDAAEPQRIGPVLFFRDYRDGRLHLAALLVRPDGEDPPLVTAEETAVSPEVLLRRDSLVVLRYAFSLPADTGGSYQVDGESFDLAGMGEGDLQLAYVSCNGQERGDRERHLAERNTMWQRLARQHAARALNLLLHGGDQLYADEMLDVHPAVQRWADGERGEGSGAPPGQQLIEELRSFLLKTYMKLYSQPAPAWLLARVPSLCMWDDHDICDGWGSLPNEQMETATGRAVFQAAREFFLLFQLGSAADDPPPICSDRTGTSLSWAVRLPGVLLTAPDLRSERQPQRVLGPAGWAAMREIFATVDQPHVFVLSSVPALGPRLSWVESVLHRIPGAQKYEDDLRDQWQSRSHREEWRRFLRELLEVHQRRAPVTLLSGEIHLATRGTMAAAGKPLHQLVASGITHPAPPVWYARLLGALARLGESPLPAHPIRLHPLPGQRGVYTAQRNYLMLQRRGGRWRAWWELERDGATPVLELDP